jgi:hypothetical protein
MATNAVNIAGSEYLNLQHACAAITRAKKEGLTDADVVVSTVAGLITAVEARRDAVTTTPQGRVAMENLLGWIDWMVAVGILDDTAADALTSVIGTAADTDFRYQISSQAQFSSSWDAANNDYLRFKSAA